MKLASLRRGGRDGTLVVLSADRTRAVIASDIAPTLQRALEDWAALAPRLAELSASLAAGTCADAFELAAGELASPLPRCFQFLDGSVYLSHMEKARRARGADMPADFDSQPLIYQGLSHGFLGPDEDAPFADPALGIDLEAEIAIVTDDVPQGISAADAGRHIRLVMLLNDWTLRELTRVEVPRGFGFLQAKPASAFSPAAVTPDEFGDAWDGNTVNLRLETRVNGRELGRPHAGQDMYFSYPQLVAHAARSRSLTAGTIIGAGTVSNRDPAAGYGCIAEARMDEQLRDGRPSTPFLQYGDVVRIDLCDDSGTSVCGAIEQRVVPA